MSLGIVDNTEFERELNKSVSTPLPVAEIIDKNVGRGKNDNEVPNSLRKIIGEEHVINGREAGLELAKSFGISKQAESAYANGSTGVKTYNKQPNLAHLNAARLRVSGLAQKKLQKALLKIDDERLDACSAPELAGVARSLSGVVKDMEPEPEREGNNGGNNGPTFIFYAPTIKSEDKYEVINARE